MIHCNLQFCGQEVTDELFWLFYKKIIVLLSFLFALTV